MTTIFPYILSCLLEINPIFAQDSDETSIEEITRDEVTETISTEPIDFDYRKPAIGSSRLQRKIENLCLTKKAITKEIPIESILSSPVTIDRPIELEDKHIILTFDDGPKHPHTRILLDMLHRCDIKAHFYLVGRRIVLEKYHETILLIDKLGHKVGSHTFNHKNLAVRDPEVIDEEIRSAHEPLEELLGRDTPFFRLPFGQGRDEEKVHKVLEKYGLVNMHWSLGSGDTRLEEASEVRGTALGSIRKRRKGVITFHPRQEHTLHALVDIIKYLVENDYILTTLKYPDAASDNNTQ
jgi:peptidoglycan/xylan/chitin deacetylase (PgdA/CDA1 family)